MLSIDAIRTICIEHFGKDPEVVGVYLFGSIADRTATGSSDIDIAVLYKRGLPPETYGRKYLSDWGYISIALGTDGVDLCVLNTVSNTPLKYAVVHDGICLFEREDLSEFELQVKSEYFDYIACMKRAGF